MFFVTRALTSKGELSSMRIRTIKLVLSGLSICVAQIVASACTQAPPKSQTPPTPPATQTQQAPQAKQAAPAAAESATPRPSFSCDDNSCRCYGEADCYRMGRLNVCEGKLDCEAQSGACVCKSR